MGRASRKYISSIAATLVSLVLVSGRAYTADVQCSQVRVAGPESYPPFTWYGEDETKAGAELDGVGVAVVREALEGTGIEVVSVRTSAWNRTLARSAAGEIDVLVALYQTGQRSEHLHFIGPYGKERTAVVSRAALGLEVGHLKQLAGLYGGAAQGDSRGDFVDGELSALTVIRAPHVRLLFAMLKAERLDYILVGEFSGLVRRDFSVVEDPSLKVHVMDEPAEGVYLGVSKRSACYEAIREPIEKAIAEMMASGRIATMKQNALSRFRALPRREVPGVKQ